MWRPQQLFVGVHAVTSNFEALAERRAQHRLREVRDPSWPALPRGLHRPQALKGWRPNGVPVPIDTALTRVLTAPAVLGLWVVLVSASLVVLALDVRYRNAAIAPLMKFVWGLTVLYSGPLGLGVYWYAGRTQIPNDSLWRKACRSVAHCYSGCGAGEVIGVTVAAGVLALSNAPVIAVTFACAYVLGYALTVGPLLQEGVGLREALADALYAETPSITVMEVVAIGTDVWLAGEAHIGEILFWSGLVFSLSIGFFAAYPVNVALIRVGVKEGMQNPADLA